MKKIFYELAVANPGAASFYCALKLEMAIYLLLTLLTEQLQSPDVPGHGAVKSQVQARLRRQLGEEVHIEALPDLAAFGHVDDFWASFEWSSGGMIHAHIAIWVVGSPRIDRVALLPLT